MRRHEDLHRGEYVLALKKTIVHYQMLAASTEEKYAHIDAEERKKVTTETSAAEQWLVEQLGKQDRLPKHEPPAVTCDQLKARQQQVESVCAAIMNKAKPPPPKKEEPKPEPKADAKPDANSSNKGADANSSTSSSSGAPGGAAGASAGAADAAADGTKPEAAKDKAGAGKEEENKKDGAQKDAKPADKSSSAKEDKSGGKKQSGGAKRVAKRKARTVPWTPPTRDEGWQR